MIIRSKPKYFKINNLLGKFSQKSNITKTFHDLIYFRNGRMALLYALRKLNINKKYEILAPALICSSALDCVSSSGYHVKYFDVDIDSQYQIKINFDKLNINDNVGAIILPIYFGLHVPFDKEKLLKIKNRNIKIILDYAHSFYLWMHHINTLSHTYDAAIFSFRKTFPVQDGGALFFNNGTIKNCEIVNKEKLTKLSKIKFIIRNVVEDAVIAIGRPNIYGKNISSFNLKRRVSDARCLVQVLPIAPSRRLCSILNNSFMIQEVKAARINNFNYINKFVTDIYKIPVTLYHNEYIVPQCFPIVDKKGGLLKKLREKGIGAYAWPGDELPTIIIENQKKYPITVKYAENIVCLPVHQDITISNLDCMIKEINSY